MLVRFDLRRRSEFGAFAANLLSRLFDEFVVQTADAPLSRSVESTDAAENDVKPKKQNPPVKAAFADSLHFSLGK